MASHRLPESAEELIADVTEAVFMLNQQVTALMLVKGDVVAIGQRLLAYQSNNRDVMITGGDLVNVFPQRVDEIIHGIQINMRNLEIYRNTL